MATILDSLKSINGYPVPLRTFEDVATMRSLDLATEVTSDILISANYRLAKADIMRWISFAPNVNQSGVSFDILYSDRERLREMANTIYGELGDEAYIGEKKVKFGYKGSRL